MSDVKMKASLDESVLSSPSWIRRTKQVLDSYERWTGESLIVRSEPATDAVTVANATFVLVAHGGEADPLLNFANRAALILWQMSLSEFLGTSSKKTAEPMHQEERAELLQRTAKEGFCSGYSGIRIASSGQRFQIHQATVWNVLDEDCHCAGQAATFSSWTSLQPVT